MHHSENPFSADPYIFQRHARSILCLPLISRAKLIGVLYLENNLTPHVFTPARTAVLKLLASQAAMSLENARLYRDAQQMDVLLESSSDTEPHRQRWLAPCHRRIGLVRRNLSDHGL